MLPLTRRRRTYILNSLIENNLIIIAYRTRLTALGVTVGSTKCLGNSINRYTGSGQAECTTTSYILRLQGLGVVTGNASCLTNRLERIT